MLAMALYPEVMCKAQHEIDTVVGGGRLPTFADAPNLPYLRAMVMEVLRWRPVAPLGSLLGVYLEVKMLTVLSLQGFLGAQQRYLLNLVPVILFQYFLLGRLVQRLLYPQGHCYYCQHMVSLQSIPSCFISVQQ